MKIQYIKICVTQMKPCWVKCIALNAYTWKVKKKKAPNKLSTLPCQKARKRKVKETQSSMSEKQTAQSKNGQKKFSKEDIKMANKYMKNAQHHLLLDKGNSNVQWVITSNQAELPPSKNLQTIKAEPSHAVGGNVN